MFLKISKSNNKEYLSFVEGYRDPISKKVKQKTVEKIGYLEDLKKVYSDPIVHFKQLAKVKTKEKKFDNSFSITINNLDIATIDENSSVFNIGYVVLKYIYQELGLKKFFDSKQRTSKKEYSLNDVFSLLVFSRILYPASKKETFENKNIFFENFAFSEDNMYNSINKDFYKFKNDIEKTLWENSKNKFKRDTSITYYDCTNYYFEIEYNDNDTYKLDNFGNPLKDKYGELIIEKEGYRKRGPEKNHRPDPIIEMGLLMDSSGIPLAYDLFPGNKSEKLSLLPIINRSKNNFNFERTIVVADRGLNTSDNILLLSGTNLEDAKKLNGYVYGQSVRGADEEFKNWVLNGNYITDIIKDEEGNKIKFIHKSRIYPKTMYVTRQDKGKTKSNKKKKEKILVDQKQMVYYSQKYADKQKRDREMIINKAKDLIKNPSKYKKSTSYGIAGYINNLKFVKETGEIANTNNLELNNERIEEEEKYDGYYSIVTSEENLSDIEIRNIYRGLSKIEETFKVTKSNLETRPVFVWTPESIESHFLTCFVSLVIIRLIEKILDNKYSTKKIINSLKNYQCFLLKENIYQVNYIDDILKEIEKKLNIDLNKKYLTKEKLRRLLKY